MKKILLLLLILLFSCSTKKETELKKYEALIAIKGDTLKICESTNIDSLKKGELKEAEYFAKVNLHNSMNGKNIQRKHLFIKLIDKNTKLLSSFRLVSEFPEDSNKMVQHSINLVGEPNLYPLNDMINLSNLIEKANFISNKVK